MEGVLAQTVRHRVTVRLGILTGLGLALAAVAVVNLGTGAVHIAPTDVVRILLSHLGLDTAPDRAQDAVLWQVRLPRLVLGGLVGGGLGVAGATLQGLFRNPLAEPAVIGVSSGAAVGAVAVIIGGLATAGTATVPIAAFVTGLVASLVVFAVAQANGRTEVVTLVLAGIAVNGIAAALTGLLIFGADDQQLRSAVFWTLGSLGGATWPMVGAVVPMLAGGMIVLPRFGSRLNILALGDREAGHLGLDVQRLRIVLIALVALTTGAAVAAAGVIGFVGLVVPHLVRLAVGPDHRIVLPASALGGALLLLTADLVARTVVVPAELPLGIVTALVGAPYFLWLIRRNVRVGG